MTEEKPPPQMNPLSTFSRLISQHIKTYRDILLHEAAAAQSSLYVFLVSSEFYSPHYFTSSPSSLNLQRTSTLETGLWKVLKMKALDEFQSLPWVWNEVSLATFSSILLKDVPCLLLSWISPFLRHTHQLQDFVLGLVYSPTVVCW